jgi:hypothetical protein
MMATMNFVEHQSGKLQAQHAGAMHFAAQISASELSTRQLDGCQLAPFAMHFSQAAFSSCCAALLLAVDSDRSTDQRTGRPTNDKSVAVLQTTSPMCSTVKSNHFSAEKHKQAHGEDWSALIEPASQVFAEDAGC